MRTPTIEDSRDVEWEAPLTIPLPDSFTTGKLRVAVWDDDDETEGDLKRGRSADNAMGGMVVAALDPCV